MLGAGGNAVFLNAADIACSHLACKIGILTEVFKVPAAQGAALDVQSRPKQYRHTHTGSFFSHGFPDFLAQFRIP